MIEDKVTPQVAEQEFERFADIWAIDLDETGLDEDDLKMLAGLRRRLTKQIRAGKLTVDESGALTYQLGYSDLDGIDSLTFNVPKGDSIMAWDRMKEREGIHKMNAFIGSMTGQSPKLFAKLDMRDLKVCQAVAQLFLGS